MRRLEEIGNINININFVSFEIIFKIIINSSIFIHHTQHRTELQDILYLKEENIHFIHFIHILNIMYYICIQQKS